MFLWLAQMILWLVWCHTVVNLGQKYTRICRVTETNFQLCSTFSFVPALRGSVHVTEEESLFMCPSYKLNCAA